MMKHLRAGSVALLLYFIAVPTSTAAASPWVSGFYAGWTASSYPPSAVDFSSLTHVMVFSVLPQTNGTLDTTLFIDAVNGPLVAQQVAQRAHASGRSAILTVGGAGTESGFVGATSSQNMSAFVKNLIGTVNAWGFDGIDIDWEPMPASDYAAVLSLINNLRSAKPGMTITIDVGWLNTNFALSSTDARFYASLSAAVDQMNMMTYQMADNWGGWASWHSSALAGDGGDHPSSVSSSAAMYMNAGVPAAKLGIGIGFYGSCWNAPVTAPLQAPGSAYVVASDNTMSFANIMNQYYVASNYRYDSTASAPYLSFGTATGPSKCTFVSYENETSVAAKGQYVRQSGLGGTIIWQLAEGYNPTASDPNSLLHAVGSAFLGGKKIQAVAGVSQSAPEATTFPQQIEAQLLDSSGLPVAGVAVTFAAPSSGASAAFNGSSSVTVVTDANGLALAPMATANTHSGSYVVVASTAGASSVAFGLTNTPVAPFRIAATAGTPQSALVNSSFTQSLQATVTDAYANPVGGVAVTFTTPSTGASATFNGATTATVTTGANGIAVAPVLTANGLTGTYTVTAAEGSYTTSFSLTNVARKKKRR